MRRRRLALAAVPVALLLAAVLAVGLSQSDRSAGDNGKPIIIGVVVPGERTFCQADNLVPADAARVRVWVSTAGRPGNPLEVTIRDGQRVVARGRGPGGYVDRATDIRLDHPPGREIAHASVCIGNEGPKQAAFMGDYAGSREAPARAGNAIQPQAEALPGDVAAHINGVPADKQQPIVARIDFRRGGDQTWFGAAPEVLQRASYGRASFFGRWTIWAAIIASLIAGCCAIVLAARQAWR